MSGSIFASVLGAVSRAALLGALAIGCSPSAEDHGVPAAYLPPYSGADVAMPYGQGIPDSFVGEVAGEAADAGSTATDTATAQDTGPTCTDVNVGGVWMCIP